MTIHRLRNLALAALVLSGQAWTTAVAHEGMRDVGKRMIERPLEQSIAPGNLPTSVLTKKADQLVPLRSESWSVPWKAVARSTAAKTPAANAQPFTNPHVSPGLVKWHSNYAEALASSKISGKPVLLFQMMGNLDDKFC